MFALHTAQAACTQNDLNVVVLGSGGPELSHQRASTAYLVREGKHHRFLIDVGSGSVAHLVQLGGNTAELGAILISHLHVDHVNDLPIFIKQTYFDGRTRDLPILGPSGATPVPSISEWLKRQFSTHNGAFSYLSEYWEPNVPSDYKIRPTIIPTNTNNHTPHKQTLFGFELTALSATHGNMPSLSWRLDKNGCSVTFSSDTSNQNHHLEQLAHNTDLLIVHHAIPEHAGEHAKRLHVTPSEIGRIAQRAQVKNLVLSHIMQRSEEALPESLQLIRTHYTGPVHVAHDMDTLSLTPP